MSLEVIVNSSKGFLTGLAEAADPIGMVLSDTDYWINGVGPGDKKRALKTFPNATYQFVYSNPEKPIDFDKEYSPRIIGNFLGTIAGIGGLVALYLTAGPVVALAIPGVLGAYSTLSTVGRYTADFIRGEEINGKREKASFIDGMKSGYHQYTHHWIFNLGHKAESLGTGKGLNNSWIESEIKDSAKSTRRNLSSVAGYVMGGIAGLATSVLSLGIVPFYKSSRAIAKTYSKN